MRAPSHAFDRLSRAHLHCLHRVQHDAANAEEQPEGLLHFFPPMFGAEKVEARLLVNVAEYQLVANQNQRLLGETRMRFVATATVQDGLPWA